MTVAEKPVLHYTKRDPVNRKCGAVRGKNGKQYMTVFIGTENA